MYIAYLCININKFKATTTMSQDFRLYDGFEFNKDLFIDEMLGPDALAVVGPTMVYLLDFFCSGISFFFFLLLSPYFCFISFLYLDLYVIGDDALIS